MENIIKELVGIENSAAEIAHVSRGRVAELRDAAGRCKEAALSEIRLEAALCAKKREEQAAAELADGLAAIRSELDARLASLSRYYESNKDKLARGLFERVRGESP